MSKQQYVMIDGVRVPVKPAPERTYGWRRLSPRNVREAIVGPSLVDHIWSKVE